MAEIDRVFWEKAHHVSEVRAARAVERTEDFVAAIGAQGGERR